MGYFKKLIFLCALLQFPAFSLEGQTTLNMDDLQIDPRGDSVVKFTSSVATPGVQIDGNQRMKMRPYSTNDGLYRVYVAFDRTAPTVPPSDINYYLYSQPIHTAQADVFTEHVIVGTPRGDFSDQWSWVKFHLNENGMHEGSLELPIHSFSNAALISIETDSAAETVYLSDPDHKVGFTARNSLKGFDIYLEGADLTTTHDDYWRWNGTDHRYAARFDSPNGSPPFPLATTPLTGAASIEPAFWRSLSASVRSFRTDQYHDTLNLTVRYNAGLGGNPRAVTIPIKVRFRPPWWSLLGVVMIGAILGSLCTLGFPQTWKATSPWKTLRSAISLAVVVEILGMLMFMGDDSKLVIAGFNLIPTEFCLRWGWESL
jgi:hypothetical protein